MKCQILFSVKIIYIYIYIYIYLSSDEFAHSVFKFSLHTRVKLHLSDVVAIIQPNARFISFI